MNPWWKHDVFKDLLFQFYFSTQSTPLKMQILLFFFFFRCTCVPRVFHRFLPIFCCDFELDGRTASKESKNIKLCGWKIAIMNNSTTVNCKWPLSLSQSCISKPTCVRFTLQIVLQPRCKIAKIATKKKREKKMSKQLTAYCRHSIFFFFPWFGNKALKRGASPKAR